MKKMEISTRDFIGLSTLNYTSLTVLENKVVICAEISKKTAICPICGKIIKNKHSHYTRTILDSPICGKTTHIQLKTRRFFCHNKYCDRVVFSEQSIDFTPYARLSKRTSKMLSKIMIEVSATKGSVIAKSISLCVSISTCLRLVHSLSLPEHGQISNLGIDDWALRKGCVYGTALVNMDTGKIIDLLPGRDGLSLSDWLRNQKQILTVNRDRSSSYSWIVSKHNPNIEQIADRFHLVKNLSEHTDAILHTNSRLINSIITEEKLIYIKGKIHKNSLLFDIAKSKLAQGYSQIQVAKEVGLSRYTIWKYAQIDSYPIDIRRTTIFDKYKSIIEKQLAKGTCLWQIHQLMVQAGYKGARSNFYNHFGNQDKINPFQKTMSISKLSKYMFSENIQMIPNKIEHSQIQVLCKKLPWFIPLNKLCSSFSGILKNGTKNQLGN